METGAYVGQAMGDLCVQTEPKVRFFLNLVWINITVNVTKIVIKFSQGSASTQTTLGGLITYLLAAYLWRVDLS